MFLEALDFPAPAAGQPAVCRLRWRIAEPRKTFPWLMLVLSDGRQLRTIVHGLCAPGAGVGAVEEVWTVRLPPDFPAATYGCFAVFYDHRQAAWAGRLPPSDSAFTLRTIPLGYRRLEPR